MRAEESVFSPKYGRNRGKEQGEPENSSMKTIVVSCHNVRACIENDSSKLHQSNSNNKNDHSMRVLGQLPKILLYVWWVIPQNILLSAQKINIVFQSYQATPNGN